MGWLDWVGIGLLAFFALFAVYRFARWLFFSAQFTMAEMLGTLIVAMLTTTFLYHFLQYLGLVGRQLSLQAAAGLMLPGLVLAFAASGLAWWEIKREAVVEARARLKIMLVYWFCLLGTTMLPLLIPLLFARSR